MVVCHPAAATCIRALADVLANRFTARGPKIERVLRWIDD